MPIIDSVWLKDFDSEIKHLFAIDHIDAGMDDANLLRYSDLSPREAAVQFGDDYGLDRIPIHWWD